MEEEHFFSDNNLNIYSISNFYGYNMVVTSKIFKDIKNQNTGYAGGNNLGINFCLENIRPRYIWILNPDTVIDDNTPIELIKTVEYTDVPVVTCKMIDSFSKSCQYNGKNVSYNGGLSETYGIFRARSLSGANIFMKTEVIDKIGLFEEKFFLYFEDDEYNQRMKKIGIYPLYTPFCHIFHKGAVSTEGYLKNPLSVYYYVRNLLHFKSEGLDESKSIILEHILRNEIEALYIQNIRKRDILIAIILGMYDYFKEVYGKVDITERFNNIKCANQLTLEWDLNYILNKTFEYLLKKPRDTDKFIEMRNLIYGIILSKTLTDSEVY